MSLSSSPQTIPGCDSSPGFETSLDNVLELLRPGCFVHLKDHPEDLPPFQLIFCHGGRCWVRQQPWGRGVYWEVPHRRLTAERARKEESGRGRKASVDS